MKSNVFKLVTGVLVLSLMSGCFSISNIKTQQRIHNSKQRPVVIKASNLNDGSPGIGIDLSSLSAWDAIKTNKTAAIGAASLDALIAAAIGWGVKESGILDSDKKDSKSSVLPPVVKDSTVVNNLGSGGVSYKDTDYRWESSSSPTPTAPGVYNSTIINNAGNGWVNYEAIHGSKPVED